MTGDFNIRDSDWDPSFPYHSPHTESLLEIADSLGLQMSTPTNPVSTRYVDNPLDSNSVIDLMFLQHNSPILHNYNIMPNLCKPSDHAPLTVELSIYEENNQSVINILVEDSDEETNFLRDLIYVLSSTDTINITNTTDLENTVNMFARALEELWGQYSKYPNITRHSKQWWNTECTSSIVYY